MSKSSKPYRGLPMEGSVATWYDRQGSRNRDFANIARDVVSRLPPGGAVLEVAPGPGYLAIELARLGAGRVAGLDISRSFVEIARGNARRAGVEVEISHGDAAHLPYPDAGFDQIVCVAAFKNFTDPLGSLDEMHRVLRPGGSAAIYDLCREDTREVIRAAVARMGQSWWSALFTRITLGYLRRFHAYPLAQVQVMAERSRFRGGRISHDGMGYELRLVRNR